MLLLFDFEDVVPAKHVEQGFRKAGIPAVTVWPIPTRNGWLPNCDCGEHYRYYVAVDCQESEEPQ